VPTAYALNKAVDSNGVGSFVATTQKVVDVLGHHGSAAAPADPAAAVKAFVASRTLNDETIPALRALAGKIGEQVKSYGSLANVPAASVGNVRNDMYLASEAIRLMQKQGKPAFSDADKAVLKTYAGELNNATKFIPTWVKVAVALALGLGTMVGWKRIVVTVGEKIGKEHLTYAQGASAEIVAMATIGAADAYGLPVSTTHVLSSGVAGTMAANRSGLQWGTIRNLIMAWVLTLPMSIVLAGVLYWIFRHVF
jgi:PiT family inorganic phosphate transporter